MPVDRRHAHNMLPGSNTTATGRKAAAQWLSALCGTAQAKADVRGIERPIALQILKTLARYNFVESSRR